MIRLQHNWYHNGSSFKRRACWLRLQASQDPEDASRDVARTCLQVVRVANEGPPEGQQHTLQSLASSAHGLSSDSLETCCTHRVPVTPLHGEA